MENKQLVEKKDQAAACGQENGNQDNLSQENPAGTALKSSSFSELNQNMLSGGGGALPCLSTGIRPCLRNFKLISGDTLARLIHGEFVEQLGPGTGYQIIDCRYPYEFTGGHIRGARNLYTRGQILEAFSRSTPMEAGQRRCIYVFHCEFSSERAPKLLRFLLGKDRRLTSPELYLLRSGYNKFYAMHPDLCEPCRYVPMRSPAHRVEFRYFRAGY